MALNLSVQNESGGAGLPTYADFIGATPEERNAYLMKPWGNFTGSQAAAYNLRNITLDGGWQPLSNDQYSSILTSSGLDPAIQQAISGQLGGVLQRQARDAADNSLNRDALLAGGAFVGAGLGADVLLGTGAAGGAAPAALDSGAFYGSNAELDSMLAGFGGDASAGGSVAEGAVSGGIPGIDTIPSGEFVDNWDMLPNPDTVYQAPGQFDMPLPNGGVTGGMGADAGLWDTLKQYGAPGVNALKTLLGGNASGGSTGNPALDKALGIGGADIAARSAPGIAALAYANKQPGLDVGPLKGILSGLGGNQDAVIRAATDPFQQNIAAGYGDILRSQGQRGIRGSSFGDTDIANYISTTGRSLANAGANAAEGSLTLQGNLASNIAQLQNQAQQIKNSLYGRAFDVLGRGLNPSGYQGARP